MIDLIDIQNASLKCKENKVGKYATEYARSLPSYKEIKKALDKAMRGRYEEI